MEQYTHAAQRAALKVHSGKSLGLERLQSKQATMMSILAFFSAP